MKFSALVACLTGFLLAASPRLYGDEELQQETLSIMGDRGLPKTMYIVPWKLLGEPLEGGEFASGVGEEIDPIERDLFRRELQLHSEGYSVE